MDLDQAHGALTTRNNAGPKETNFRVSFFFGYFLIIHYQIRTSRLLEFILWVFDSIFILGHVDAQNE